MRTMTTLHQHKHKLAFATGAAQDVVLRTKERMGNEAWAAMTPEIRHEHIAATVLLELTKVPDAIPLRGSTMKALYQASVDVADAEG